MAAPRKDEILDAARALFAEHGFDATSMDLVRRAAGVSNGSLFHHFPTKESLLAGLYLRTLAEYHASIARVLRRKQSASSTVSAIVRTHLRWVAANEEKARLLHEARWSEAVASAKDDLTALNRAMFAELRAWTEREHAALRAVETSLLVAIVLGPAMEFTRAWLRDPDPARMRRAAPVLADAAWQAIRRKRS